MSLSRLKAAAQTMFGKYLLATNMVATGTLLATGDILEQQVLQRLIRKDKEVPIPPHDWSRTRRMFILGFCASPFPHFWYKLLDKVLPSRAGSSVMKKVVADQLLGTPIIYVLFYCGGALLEGASVRESFQELKSKFLVTYVADWAFWVPAQTINFRFLPPQYRVLYVMTLSQIWTVFLSWMKHEYGKREEGVEAEAGKGGTLTVTAAEKARRGDTVSTKDSTAEGGAAGSTKESRDEGGTGQMQEESSKDLDGGKEKVQDSDKEDRRSEGSSDQTEKQQQGA